MLIDRDKLKQVVENKIITWERKEKQSWTNCEGFRISFEDSWRKYTYFMKKSFLKWWKFEEDYNLLKSKLKNIIPNTVFIKKCNWDIFSFSEPVIIDFDILEDKNINYFKQILKNDEKLLKQLKFFIKKFRELEKNWKIIDLYWKENLVYTKEWKIKYIDSFLVFCDSNVVVEKSIENIKKLENIIKEFNF